jgi:hypothetical protein
LGLQSVDLCRDLAYGKNPSGKLSARGQLQIPEQRESLSLILSDAQKLFSILFEKTESVVNGNSQLVVNHLHFVFSKIVQSLCQEVSGPVTSVVDKLFSSCQNNFSGLSDSTQSLIIFINCMQLKFDSSI